MEHEFHEYSNAANGNDALVEVDAVARKIASDLSDNKILYKDLSYRIIKACFEVHRTLGPGYPEKIYEEAMALELKVNGVDLERQKLIEVFYKGVKVGEYRLDFIVEKKIVLEFKAVSELNAIFEAQVLSYLKATGMKLGLLINFGGKRLTFRRIVN